MAQPPLVAWCTVKAHPVTPHGGTLVEVGSSERESILVFYYGDRFGRFVVDRFARAVDRLAFAAWASHHFRGPPLPQVRACKRAASQGQRPEESHSAEAGALGWLLLEFVFFHCRLCSSRVDHSSCGSS